MVIRNLDIQDAIYKKASLKFRLYLALLKDVVDDFPKAVQATISSNVLKPGAKHFYADFKPSSIKPVGSPGDTQGTIGLEFSPEVEGLSQFSLDWLYKFNGERVIAIWEVCDTKQKFIAGSPCSGGLLVTINSLGIMENGTMGAVINFKGDPCPEPYYFYDGPILLEDPTPVAADAITFALTNSVQYQLQNNTKATELTSITGVGDSDVGRIFELIGSGSNQPTTIKSSAAFILRNGVSWSGTSGSKITFEVIKTGAGAYSFLELARS